MHLKVFLKLKKPKKTLSSGQIYKKDKKTKKKQKKNKKPPKNHWAGFFFLKTGFFPTLRAGACVLSRVAAGTAGQSADAGGAGRQH